ncbi:E3 ubiquitin-protein ligase LRSAM1-like isoform X2 [Clavelina lepadiformis]|uniref:E3 ubiquitin-protein ligase LRSAM1-like isoform X2 n=1 Tax=Clavelina lepadiformis TaxID=159417 RepID=UPI0040426525
MPSFFQSKKQSKEAKRRFENLMTLAKNNPEKIFDLSNCELTVLPSVFAQCRVLLSNSLILHSNCLKSLKEGGKMVDLIRLRILDIHDNHLRSLPGDIGSLSNLQILNIENNHLTELPQSIGQLKKLQSFLARNNFLNCIPSTIQTMSSLRTLDISGTNQVYFLPKTLCYVRTLEVLVLSKPHCMEYPPAMIATEGLETIQKFLCKDCGVDYIPPSHGVLKILDQTDGPSTTNQTLSNDFAQESKLKQQLELEEKIAESHRKQAVISAQQRQERMKDQVKVIKQNVNLDKALKEQQEKRLKERQEMLQNLKQVEEEATSLVTRLLNLNEKAQHQEKLMETLERQRIQEEEYFKVTQEDMFALRKKETLAAMEKILEENRQHNLLFQKYMVEHSDDMQKAQHSMGRNDDKIIAQLEQQRSFQGTLVQQILAEENLQKEAFVALQLQQDAIQNRIIDQISQLEQELVKITIIEAQRKDIKSEFEQQTLSATRNELTDLLTKLLKQKYQREETIKERLVEMECQRQDDQIDFWLVQYQRLLDSKPERLIQKEQGLDTDVLTLLRKSGAADHIASFAKHKIATDNIGSLSDRDLLNIGVFEVGIRQNILREIETFITQRKIVDIPREENVSSISEMKPTPPMPVASSEVAPSAPSATSILEDRENECVICLDKSCDCIFLPCGHVCSCYTCATGVNSCPMCRSDITQKIRMFRS